MNRRILSLLAALLLLTGCAAPTSELREIRISTAATTGALYPLGGALASLWGEKLENARVTAQASAGGIENLRLLAQGETELGFAVTSLLWEAQNGEGSFAGEPNDKLRVLAGLYYNPNQVVVTRSSGVTSLSQLQGLRFAAGAAGSTTAVETELHLTAAGLRYPDEIDAQFIGFTEAVELMRNRQLDGAWIMAGLGNAAVTEMTATAGGRLVPMEEELIAEMCRLHPWYARYVIPAGTYAGQEEDVPTTAIKLALFCSADLDEQTAYELTRALWENLDALSQATSSLAGVTVEQAVTDLAGVPLHDGAARYYAECGLTLSD